MSEKFIEKPESGLSEEEAQFYRNAAEITLARVGKYEELNAANEEEGNERFREIARETWQFAVHEAGSDGERKYPDLDGACSLGLFKLAKFKKAGDRDVEFVPPGELRNDKVNLDTGGRHGIVIGTSLGKRRGRSKLNIKTAFIDHHAPDSGEPEKQTSTTALVYKMLSNKDFGFLQKSDALNRLTHYVTVVDNKQYLDDFRYNDYFKNYFNGSWRTLLGLQKFTKFDELHKHFLKEVDHTKELSDGELKRLGFIYKNRKGEEKNRVLEMKDRVEKSKKELERMEREGLIIDSDKYGKIAVDIDRRVQEGIDAARAFGCEAYISWSPDKNFYINTIKPLEEKFSQGKKIRGRMWLKPNEEKDQKMTLRLSEVLTTMTGGKFEAQGELKKFLEQEAKGEFETAKGGAPDNLPIEAQEDLEASVVLGRQLMEQFGIKTLAQKRQMLKWLEKRMAGMEVK